MRQDPGRWRRRHNGCLLVLIRTMVTLLSPQQGHSAREGNPITSSEVLLEIYQLQKAYSRLTSYPIIKIHSSREIALWYTAHSIKPKNLKLVPNPSNLKKRIKAITSIRILELLRALGVKIHLNWSRINRKAAVASWVGCNIVHVILESRNLGRQHLSLRQEPIETSKRSMEAAQRHKSRHRNALPAEVMFEVLQQLVTQREFQNLRSRIWVQRTLKSSKV